MRNIERKSGDEGRSETAPCGAASSSGCEPAASIPNPGEAPSQGGEPSRTFAIVNRRGLHARASARFVETVENFDAEVTITRDGMSVGGLSIMGLLMLAASQGTTIDVSARGPEASAVLDALQDLVANRFGEDG